MAATYDSVNDRVLLTGDGTGWSRCKKQLPTPPAGTNQATYVMRFWVDDAPTLVGIDSTPTMTWDKAFYYGFKFNSTYLTQPALNYLNRTESLDGYPHAVGYKDFFGMSFSGTDSDDSSSTYEDTFQRINSTMYDASAGSNTTDWFAPGRRTYYFGKVEYYSWNGFYTGNGFLDSGSAVTEEYIRGFWPNQASSGTPSYMNSAAHCLYPGTATKGAATTVVWRVWTHESNETVYLRTWVNESSLSLSSSLLESINPDNPEDTIQPTRNTTLDTYTSDLELNNSTTTGSNWRPSSGVMGFPTHFMAQFPFASQQLVIDFVGVRYDTLS